MASAVLIWIYYVSSVLITISALVHLVAPSLPQFFRDLLLYGKSRGDRTDQTFVQKFLEVPKSWFLHFYAVGVAVNSLMFYTVTTSYLQGVRPAEIVTYVFEKLVNKPEVHTGAGSAMILVGMMLFQNTRRLYECMYVSVYSRGTMNVGHYALGMLLYSTFSFAVLSEAPLLGSYKVTDLGAELLTIPNILGVVLFLYASYHHNYVHVQFANFRKDREGKVTGTGHVIPHGGWFEYVSCPHYLAEILIYIAMAIVGGLAHMTLLSVIIFVLDNQVVAAYISHRWYKETYKEKYPKNRRAIIPFLL